MGRTNPNISLSVFIALYLICISFSCFSQQTEFIPADSLRSYHIVTLKDGTVLKGKILVQERKSIQFQDEIIGKVTFRTKDVTSLEKVEPQEYYLVTLMNGTTIQGKIVDRKENELIMETANIGRITVDASKIKNIKSINPGNMKDGKYWFTTHVDAHYFLAPSAIPLRPGEAYYQNTMGAFNSFNIGITPNISCMGGIIIPTVVFISPRVNFKIAKGVYAGGGIFFADITSTPYAGAGFGQITFGSRKGHVSAGGGYGYLGGIQRYYYTNKIESIEFGMLFISGMKRLSPKTAIVTENWFAPTEGVALLTAGMRLLGEKNTWDFGLSSFSADNPGAGNSFSLGPITFISYMRNL